MSHRREVNTPLTYDNFQAAEKLAGDLVKKKFNARPYHAGLDKDIRSDIQDKFLRSDSMIVCCTSPYIGKPY